MLELIFLNPINFILCKEYLKLLGIKWYMIWITWFIRIFSPYIVLSVLFTILTQIRLYNSKDSSINKATFMQTGKKKYL